MTDTARRAIGAATAHLLRLSGQKLGAAIMYHRVGSPAGDPARELVPNLAPELFEAQVKHLRGSYRLVRASELTRAATARRRGQRIPVAITFDDDLACHLEVAAPLLERLRAPATFFLTGATLEGPSRFWWEHLQHAVDSGVVQTENIHALGEEIRLAERPRRETMVRELAAVPDPAPGDSGLRAADVRRLAELGFEIGFHTRRHEYLPNLDDPELADALREGRDELEAAAGGRLVSIAYPHGGGDARVAAAARAAGFEAGYRTASQAIDATTDPLLLGRIEAPFTTAGRLALILARRLLGVVRRRAGRAGGRATTQRPPDR